MPNEAEVKLIWLGNRLFQHDSSSNRQAELGYVEEDASSQRHVFWLNHYDGDAVVSQILDYSFPTFAEAKEKIPDLPEVKAQHLKWVAE